jgi:hypothetical protein
MSSDPLELKERFQAEYHARWEAVEVVKAHELAALTDEQAWQMIKSLKPFADPWRNPFNGEGLVEQQRIFHRLKNS